MILIMGVTLYMSRVVLQVLGVTDYGIYNIVGGVVAMFAFLNSALGSSTQRYITYALGENNNLKLKSIFTSSIVIHVAIAIVTIILAETIGLWFFYNKLVIPHERMTAAFWAYQASIAACGINIISIPYNSLIIAHENMGAFAYISIIEVLLKLALVFLISVFNYDKLILYASFILLSNIIIRIIYQLYCKKKFEETKLVRIKDWNQFMGILSFSGWTLIGMLAWTCQTQGLNILLNMFFGPIVNAARALADQVNNAILQVVNNFQLAAKPQIVKYYANDETKQMNALVSNVCIFSAYLLIIIFIPLSINIDYVLHLWLGEIPELTIPFINVCLIQSLGQVMISPVIMITHAVGKMKKPNVYGGFTYLLTLPLCYLILKLGGSAVVAVAASIIPVILKGYWDVYFADKYGGFKIKQFYTFIYLKTYIISSIIYVIAYVIYKTLNMNGFLSFVCNSFLSMLISMLIIYYIGMNSAQKEIIYKIIRSKIQKVK